MVFSLVRTPLPNGPRRVAVRSVDALTPTYLRIALEGDFADFESRGADDHLRLFFVPDDVDAAELAELRPFPSREYTPVSWSADELTLDVVVHGEGPGSNWAASATPGNGAMVGGPRGSQVLDGRPDHWLLAGDRTALPAIRRFAAQAASGVPVDVVVIAEDPATNTVILAVFDGHGEHGHRVSQFVKRKITSAVMEQPTFATDPGRAMEEGLRQVEVELLRSG